MTTKAALQQEIKELALDMSIAQGRFYAAQRQLQLLEIAEREAKQAKCKHMFEKRNDRQFEGAGFIDVVYEYCPKCHAVGESKIVNVVLQSEK